MRFFYEPKENLFRVVMPVLVYITLLYLPAALKQFVRKFCIFFKTAKRMQTNTLRKRKNGKKHGRFNVDVLIVRCQRIIPICVSIVPGIIDTIVFLTNETTKKKCFLFLFMANKNVLLKSSKWIGIIRCKASVIVCLKLEL